MQKYFSKCSYLEVYVLYVIWTQLFKYVIKYTRNNSTSSNRPQYF